MPVSKLHKTFSTGGASIFALTIGSRRFSDSDIVSISISRGGAHYGSNPSVLEIKVKGWQTFKRNEHVELKLTNIVRPKIGISYAQTVWRFHGRLALFEVEDRGSRKTPITTFSCSSYSTLLKLSPTPIRLSQREPVQDVIARAITSPRTGGKVKLYQLADSTSLDAGRIYLAPDEKPAKPFKDVLSSYIEKAKTLLVDMRDGQIRILTLSFRNQLMESQTSSRYAPIRSTVLSPAVFGQKNEARSYNLRYTWREYDGSTTTQQVGASNLNDAITAASQTKEESVEQVIVPTHVRKFIMRAENGSINAALRGYKSITFDILALLRHGGTYQRYVAFEALRMEHGDSVYFSADWVRQPWAMIATRLTETIKHDQWTITVELNHPMEVIGRGSTVSYPPRIWNQAISTTWDFEERQWK